MALLWRPDSQKVQYHWLEDGWPLEEGELKLSGRRLVRLMDWFLDGNQVMAYTVNMPGELIDENAEVRLCHFYFDTRDTSLSNDAQLSLMTALNLLKDWVYAVIIVY